MSEGEFKKRITSDKVANDEYSHLLSMEAALEIVDDVQKDFPTIPLIAVSDKTTLLEFNLIFDKLIYPFFEELRNYKKKWFGE